MKGCLLDPRATPTERDWEEIRVYQLYLRCLGHYGEEAMLRRRYWRIYMGLEQPCNPLKA